MFRTSRSTDFTCAASQAVCVLNICKTFHRIHMPLDFLFKFTGINLVQPNINPIKFHLIRLCSFCNIYMPKMSNFLKHPVFDSYQHANNFQCMYFNGKRFFFATTKQFQNSTNTYSGSTFTLTMNTNGKQNFFE